MIFGSESAGAITDRVANSQRINNGNFAFDGDLHQTEFA